MQPAKEPGKAIALAWMRRSAVAVEKQTGYDLLSNVLDSVQQVAELGIDRINIKT
ncbi:hypothetical protein GCM10028808_60320 [Spirosoma migulaei]